MKNIYAFFLVMVFQIVPVVVLAHPIYPSKTMNQAGHIEPFGPKGPGDGTIFLGYGYPIDLRNDTASPTAYKFQRECTATISVMPLESGLPSYTCCLVEYPTRAGIYMLTNILQSVRNGPFLCHTNPTNICN